MDEELGTRTWNGAQKLKDLKDGDGFNDRESRGLNSGLREIETWNVRLPSWLFIAHFF